MNTKIKEKIKEKIKDTIIIEDKKIDKELLKTLFKTEHDAWKEQNEKNFVNYTQWMEKELNKETNKNWFFRLKSKFAKKHYKNDSKNINENYHHEALKWGLFSGLISSIVGPSLVYLFSFFSLSLFYNITLIPLVMISITLFISSAVDDEIDRRKKYLHQLKNSNHYFEIPINKEKMYNIKEILGEKLTSYYLYEKKNILTNKDYFEIINLSDNEINEMKQKMEVSINI